MIALLAPWQASFRWLAGAGAIGTVIPLTLIAIMPTTRRLHAVRTGLGGAGLLAFLFSLGSP